MSQQNTNNNTKSIIDPNEEIAQQLVQAGQIEMRYRRGQNNTRTGNLRKELTLKIVTRFGMTSATILAHIYKMQHRQTREHLNKLVKQKLLKKTRAIRSIDGFVYSPTADGVQFVKALLNIPIFYRRTKKGLEVNHNTINHDSICQLFLLQSIKQSIQYGEDYYYKYEGLVSEHEIKKIFRESSFRILDGALIQYLVDDAKNRIIGIEIEHSFKNPKQRAEILIAYLKLLKSKVYDKIVLASHSHVVLKDAKRINDKLIVDLCNVRKKDGSTIMSGQDAALLEANISYDNNFCDVLTNLFYR